MWRFLIRMDGEQRLGLDFCADVTLLQLCHSGAAYLVSDLSQGESVSKGHKLTDRKFLKVFCAEEQIVLPPKVLHSMRWFPIPLFGFWLHCQTGLFPGSGFCDWLHYFVFHKPNPSSSVFIGALLPGRAILWFTHSPAKLLRSMNFQCSKDLCVHVVCVCSLPYLPVQGLSLVSSSCYHPLWVKAGLKVISWTTVHHGLHSLITFELQLKEPVVSKRKSLIKIKL